MKKIKPLNLDTDMWIQIEKLTDKVRELITAHNERVEENDTMYARAYERGYNDCFGSFHIKGKKISDESVPKKERWKPEMNEEYCCFEDRGVVVKILWQNWYSDNERYRFGNCFKTVPEAEYAALKVKELLNSDEIGEWN